MVESVMHHVYSMVGDIAVLQRVYPAEIHVIIAPCSIISLVYPFLLQRMCLLM